MNFNQKHERYVGNLDAAYERLLGHRDAEALEREMLEDVILEDEELFTRLAIRYAKGNLEFRQDVSFLEYGVEILRKERSEC